MRNDPHLNMEVTSDLHSLSVNGIAIKTMCLNSTAFQQKKNSDMQNMFLLRFSTEFK